MNEHMRSVYLARAKKFHERLKEQILAETLVFSASYRHCREPVPFAERLKGDFRRIQEGEKWGCDWESAWFHLTGTVPASWAGKTVVCNLELGGEGLLFDESGCPVYSFSNGCAHNAHFKRMVYPLVKSAKGGEKLELWVEASASHLFGLNQKVDPADKCPDRYGSADGKANLMQMAAFEGEVFGLAMDVDVLVDLLSDLPADSVRYSRVMNAINKAINAYGENSRNAAKARACLKPEFDRKAADTELTSITVGHAHIDTGWLWPVRETIRKCARTFSAQIALIDRYPGYIFGASQPQHYAFTKAHYPALYEKIKNKVKEGTWELQGGMWVEADCNVTSGESLVRQVLHGKNFYMDEFGHDVRNLWIPDVFGYAAAMPQIMKKCGVDFFLTQKISWSQFNRFPHHTFKWRGIDGTEMITHFPPEDSYNSILNPAGQRRAERKFAENHFLDEFMCLFGIGDGGGGPTPEMLERGERLHNMADCPKLTYGTAQAFFDRLQKHEDELEVWMGELYLELHRGTLTTQALVKKMNRKCELRLREVEYLCSFLPLPAYPRDTFDRLWKVLLINQFHDILPGSSITEVYKVTHAEHIAIMKELGEIEREAAQTLFTDNADAVTLVNTLSVAYRGVVELPQGWDGCKAKAGSGEVVAVQKQDGKTLALVKIAANGLLQLEKAAGAAATVSGKDLVLENALVRYTFAKDGTLVSAYDKTAACAIMDAGDKGNLFSLYEDRPNNWDAWDIDIFYDEQLSGHAEYVDASAVAAGPVQGVLKFVLTIGSSKIEQTVTLSANSKRLDFATTIDWHEKHRMLRVAFPTAIRTDKAIFDIQYGYAERATHDSTSWDMAKFEVAAHRYADLSDRDYGVALLNDCKYGYKVKENVLDLNLLRSPTYPDPDADQGRHELVYALLPHEGTLIESDVMAEAACLNQGVLAFAGKAIGKAAAPVCLESEGISLEVLKKSEKSETRVIRLVETKGRRSKGTLRFSTPATFEEVDMMEWNVIGETGSGVSLNVTLKPFEIRTYRLTITVLSNVDRT